MNPAPIQMPSAGGLLLRVAIAALVGAVLTVCVIMPAEYRKDPTGFGKLTGLIALSTPTVAKPAEPSADSKSTTTPALTTNAWFYPTEYRTDTVKIPLGPDGELEYKVYMKAGESMVYSWAVDRGTVYYDFHGDPNDPKRSQRYREEQENTKSNGAFVAPFEGIHGWFFLNLTGEKQVITLKMSGFYQLHKM